MSDRRPAKVLFFSSMVVSPATGGGNAAHNLLESGPPWGEVFYATPAYHRLDGQPFAESAPRICRFFNVNRPLPRLPGAEAVGAVRWANERIKRFNDWAQRETIVRDVSRCVEQKGVDVLLLCPQNPGVDLPAAPELVRRTGLPSVAWFMDDYFKDEASRKRVAQVWGNAHRRFVASDSMREHYSALYGGECGVLNNAVAFPERYPEPTEKGDRRLRIVYAGAMNAYYLKTMSKVLGELQGLEGQVELDIYSLDGLPPEWRSKTDVPWRHLPPVAPEEIGRLLQRYDALLLLSSFEPGWRTVAETAQAGKMADYLAAGRCIIAYGPPYAENVRYLEKHGIGATVTSPESGALRGAVLSLARSPNRRRELGEKAYYFGREQRDKAVYSARLWRALQDAASLPPARSRGGPERGMRKLFGDALFEALKALGRLRIAVWKVVKGREA